MKTEKHSVRAVKFALSICGHLVLRTKLSKGLGQDEKTIPSSLPLTSPQLPLFCELVLQRTLRDT